MRWAVIAGGGRCGFQGHNRTGRFAVEAFAGIVLAVPFVVAAVLDRRLPMYDD